MLMKVYGVLVSKEWGALGIDQKVHIFLEQCCCRAIFNYADGVPLRCQVVQLGGLEMFMKTLLRKQLQGHESVLENSITSMHLALRALCK